MKCLNWRVIQPDSPFSLLVCNSSSHNVSELSDTFVIELAASSLVLMESIFLCTTRVVLLLKCNPDYASPLLKNRLGHSIICPVGSGQTPVSPTAHPCLGFKASTPVSQELT